MDDIQNFLNTIEAGKDTKPSDINLPTSSESSNSQYLSHGQVTLSYGYQGDKKSSENDKQ